ncbi:glucose-6-phosphate dehydrogenase assembly protein OpcA, partial [Paenarthrobacter sp. NPDC058040]|uniref:glucose-6-phosphate dehydrogenase assembly protein OpcA n=1 Tax=unclassified Paenarthrobacter TaxID=2634190 RepID=UPI0036D8BFFA
QALDTIRQTYKAGDTDLAWTRLTNWRIQLAAAVDHIEPESVTAAQVEGAPDSPSTMLLAAWLRNTLRVPVNVQARPSGSGVRRVLLLSEQGHVQLFRPDHYVADLTQPGQPAQRITLPRRSLKDCLAEELRRLDPDEVFGDTLALLDPIHTYGESPLPSSRLVGGR